MVKKKKAALTNLPKLMVMLTLNVIKFNSRVISTAHNLKHNSSSPPNLLHQLFPAYLIYPNKQFHNYIVLKQNKFKEGRVMKPEHLIKYTRYKYKTLLHKGEW